MSAIAGFFDRRGRWLAAIAGAALPLGFAPFGWFGLAPVLLACLFLSWRGQDRREAARRGFIFGAAAFGAGTYWLYISIHVFGGSPLWLAVFLMLGLVMAMAVYIALAGALSALAGQLPPWATAVLLWPAIWTLFEWLRGWFLSGFPWLSLGYGQIDGPLAAWAPLLGVYGLSWLTALLAGALACLVVGGSRDRLAALGLAAAIALGTALIQGQVYTQPAGEPLRVALVQGSIAQDRKWLPEQRRPTMALYRDLTFGIDDVDLVVWPEVAIPAMAHQVDAYLDDLDEAARERDLALLLGILIYDFDAEEFHNSLLSLGRAQGIYDKRHLVPFGEFFPVPGFIREWMRLMSLPYRDTTPGERNQSPLVAAGVPFSPSICYEDAFGAEQRDFLPAALALVNVSNDAWFGDSIAPHQHLQIARMRALETGRYLLRATNTGITAIIDPAGRVVAGSPQFEAHVLRGQIQPRSGATPFIRYGNWPVVLACLLLAGGGLAWSRRP